MMHTRICLLEGNFDKAELLRHNLDYNFDVITLNETSHIEKNKTFASGFTMVYTSNIRANKDTTTWKV